MTDHARFRLRWSEPDGLELYCHHCQEWWALDADFWRMNQWDMCIACTRERHRLYQAKRKARDPIYHRKKIENLNRYRDWLRKYHPDLIRAYDRDLAARHRERRNAARAAARDVA